MAASMSSLSAQRPDVEATVTEAIRTLIERREVADVTVTRDAKLQDGLGFDSLELAELSAVLEEDLGSDPYTHGIIPETVGDIIAFYER